MDVDFENDPVERKKSPSVALVRFAARRSSSVLALALLVVVGCAAFVWTFVRQDALPLASLAPREEARLGDSPVVRESYFVVIGADPAPVKEALDYVSGAVVSKSKALTLSRWGIDANSLEKKRLYLLSNEESLELSNDLETAHELARGGWDFLNAEAFLRRFDRRLRSEMTFERDAAVDDATPFVEALAATTDVERFDEEQKPIASPVAPGALKYVDAAIDKRYFLSEDKLRGVVAAAWNSAEPTARAVDALQAILRQARSEFPDLTIELDSPEAAKRAELDAAFRLWTRAGAFAGIAALCVGWLVFGGVRRSLAALFAALIVATPALTVAIVVGEPSVAKLGTALSILVFSYYWSAAALVKYASIRLSNRSTSESILETFQVLGDKLLGYALIFAIASLACLAVPDRDAREFGVVVAAGLPLVALFLLIVEPTLIRLADGDNPFRTTPSPLGIESSTRSVAGAKNFVFTVALLLILASVYGIRRAVFSNDLSGFLPRELAEVYRGDDAATIAGKRALYALSFAESPDELATFKARFSDEPTLIIDDLSSRLPSVTFEKRRTIETIADFLNQLPLELGEPTIPDQATLMDAILCLKDAAERAECSCGDESKRLRLLDALRRAQERIESFTPAEYRARLDAFESWTTVETVKRLYALRALTDWARPTTDDLSPEIRARYFADVSERPALFVYSTADLRDRGALQAFASNVRAICSDARGPALALFDAQENARKGATFGLTFALAAAAFLLAFRFRAASDVVAELVQPLFCATVSLGLLGLTRTPATCVSLFALSALTPAICSSNARDSKDAVFATVMVALGAALALTTSNAPDWIDVGRFLACVALVWVIFALFRAESDVKDLDLEKRR